MEFDRPRATYDTLINIVRVCTQRSKRNMRHYIHFNPPYSFAPCDVASRSQDIIGKNSYEVSLNWAHMSGHGSEDELALTSMCDQTGEEVIAIRSLEDGGNKMVLTQIVRRPAEKYEVRAKHFFKRVTSKSELSTNGRGKKKHLSSNVVTVRRKK